MKPKIGDHIVLELMIYKISETVDGIEYYIKRPSDPKSTINIMCIQPDDIRRNLGQPEKNIPLEIRIPNANL